MSKYAIETVFNLVDKITAPLNKIDGQMEKVGKTGGAVNTALKNGFADADKTLTKLSSSVKKFAAGLATVSAGAIATFATAGVKSAIEFEQSLAKVSTVAGGLPMDKASKDILAVSNAMHVAASDIAESTYNAITAGIDASQAVDFVATATKLAKAGFTDTNTAIDGLTDVLNAYGLSADKAMKISDQMILTQNYGKTSIAELTQTIGKVAPIAQSANVSTEELFASIASLTGAGSSTSKAVSEINTVLSKIIAPTSAASKLAEELGLDFSAAGLKSKGFTKFLEEVKDATGGDIEMLQTLFGSMEAYKAVDILTGKGSKNFIDALDAMTNQAGVTEKAFERMMQTPAERLAGLKNQFANTKTKLGQSLLPVLEQLADKADVLLEGLDKSVEKIASGIGKTVDKVVGLIQFVWKLRVPIIAIGGAIVAVSTAMDVAKGVQIGIIAVTKTWNAITSIAQGAQIAYAMTIKGSASAQNALAFATKGTATATKVFNALLSAGKWIKATAALIAHKVATIALSVAQGVATAATSALSTAVGVLNALFVASPIGWIVLAIGALIAVIVLCVKHWDKITEAVKFCWEKIKQFASFIWDKLCTAFSFLGEKITQAAGILKGVFLSALNAVWSPIEKIISAFKDGGIIAGIRQIGSTILQFLLKPVLSVMDVLSKLPVIGDKIGEAKDWIDEKINSVGYSALDEYKEPSAPATAPEAFTPYTLAETRHTEVNRSEMQISLDKGLNAQVYGTAPNITVQTQKTGTFD